MHIRPMIMRSRVAFLSIALAASMGITQSIIPTIAMADDDNHVEASVRMPEISLAENAGDIRAHKGDVIDMTLTLKNSGQVNANMLYVAYQAPAGTSVESVSAPSSVSAERSGNVVTMRATLKPGETADVVVSLKCDFTGAMPDATASWGQAWEDEVPETMTDLDVARSGQVVVARDIAEANVTIQDVTYDTPTPRPAAIVTDADKGTLVEGIDYTIDYADTSSAGDTSLTIAGIGDFCGTMTSSYKILPRDISDCVIAIPNSIPFRGTPVSFSPSVTYKGSPLACDRDYTLSTTGGDGAGTITATCTGKGNFCGSTKVSTVVTASIQNAKVTVDNAGAYTGKPKTPKVAVNLYGKTLKEGTDYTLSWKNNTNAGTATVTVTGRWPYTGAISATTTIAKAAQTISNVPSAKGMAAKSTLKLSPKASGAGKLSYKTSNAKVATVDKSGKVTAVAPGKATITISAASTTNHKAASKTVAITVSKRANPAKVSVKNVSAKASRLKTKTQSAKPIAVSGAIGRLTFSKTSGSKALSVNAKTGAITIKKGTKKGTYKMKVKVYAAGDSVTNSMTKYANITVKVS